MSSPSSLYELQAVERKRRSKKQGNEKNKRNEDICEYEGERRRDSEIKIYEKRGLGGSWFFFFLALQLPVF